MFNFLCLGNKTFQDNVEPLDDGYQGDVIGEATPDVIVSEFVSFSAFNPSQLLFLFYLCSISSIDNMLY